MGGADLMMLISLGLNIKRYIYHWIELNQEDVNHIDTYMTPEYGWENFSVKDYTLPLQDNMD